MVVMCRWDACRFAVSKVHNPTLACLIAPDFSPVLARPSWHNDISPRPRANSQTRAGV